MKKLYHISVYLLFIFLFASAFFIAILQTKWAKNKITNYAINYIKKKELPIKIGSIEGEFFHTYKIKNLEVTFFDKKILAKEAKLKLSLTSLLFKKISLSYLNANDIYIEDINIKDTRIKDTRIENRKEDKKNNKPETFSDDIFNFPYEISLKSFSFQNIHIDEKIISIQGKGFVKKDLKSIFIDCFFKEKNTKINFYASGSKNQIYTSLKIKTDSIKFIYPEISQDVALDISLHSKCSLQDLLSLKIKGKASGNFLFKDLEKHFQGKSFQGKPFLEKYFLNFDFYLDKKIDIKNINIFNDFISLKGNLSANFSKIENLDLNVKTKNISIFKNLPINGFLNGNISYEKDILSSNLEIKNFKIKNIPLENFKVNITSKIKDDVLEGNLKSNCKFFSEDVNISSDIIWKQKKLFLNKISLTSPSISLKGSLEIDDFIKGKIKSNVKNLYFIKNIFPSINFSGSLDLTGNFYQKNSSQKIKMDGNIKYGKFKNFQAKDIIFTINTESFSYENSEFAIQIKNLSYNKINFDYLMFTTKTSEKEFPFELIAKGKNFSIDTKGIWNILKDEITINPKTLIGIYLEKSFSIEKDFFIKYYPQNIQIKDLKLTSLDSSLYLNMSISKESQNINIKGKDLNLDFSYKNIPILGKVSFEIEKKESYGSFNIDLQKTFLKVRKKIIDVKGNLRGNLEKDFISFQTNLYSNDKKIIDSSGKIPIKYSVFPFNLEIETEKPIDANLKFKGKFEEIFDFLNKDPRSITGDCILDLSIKDTFKNPNIEGFLKLQNGTFENYPTGTYLKDISSDINFKNHMIYFDLSAKGLDNGNLIAKGSLNTKKDYSFKININISDLLSLQTDLIKAKTSGNLIIQGNKKRSKMQGKIDIQKAILTIPEKIPNPLPTLDINFIGRPKKIIKKKKKPYPVELDLSMNAPGQIFIQGRGVTAELKGAVIINGTLDDIKPKGTLNLIKGKYIFSGRNFTLKKGSITFKPSSVIPFIFVEANMKQRGVLIIATLKGSLASPKLSLTSSPALPINSILSLLLFGKPLSGISGLQALQVTSTLESVSDADLESSKKNLGIDRLSVVSQKGEDIEDPDKVAVQIGKYITKGVMVSYTQGTEEGTSNASLEIDLGLGFLLELETRQEEQQNKATLKWIKDF